MSGTAIAAKGLNPAIRVFGAEPKGADDAYRSFEAGKLLPQEGPDTFCDGLLTSLGELTWPIIRDNLEAVLLARRQRDPRGSKTYLEPNEDHHRAKLRNASGSATQTPSCF